VILFYSAGPPQGRTKAGVMAAIQPGNSNPASSMPKITLTWAAATFLPKDVKVDRDSPWVNNIEWWNSTVQLPTKGGLYVVEIPDRTIVYAGQARNFRSRFKGRSESLGDFNLRTAALGENQLYLCTTAPSRQLSLAERWLIRILYLRDATLEKRTFQNISLTVSFRAPSGGLEIINAGARPDFLDDDDSNYDYTEGTWI
jgi:hypothetical protein